MVRHMTRLLRLLLLALLPLTVVAPSFGRWRALAEVNPWVNMTLSEDGSGSGQENEAGFHSTEGLPLAGPGLLIAAVLLSLLVCSCFFGSEQAAARRDKLKQSLPGALKRAEATAVGQTCGIPDEELEMSAISRGSADSLSEVTMSDISPGLENRALDQAASVKPRANFPGRESVEVETTPLRAQSNSGDLSDMSAFETPYAPSAMGGTATIQARRRAADSTPELVSGLLPLAFKALPRVCLTKCCHMCCGRQERAGI